MIYRKIELAKTAEYLDERLSTSSSQAFGIKKVCPYEYRFNALVSFGTILPGGRPIRLFAKLKPSADNKSSVLVYSWPRIEFILILIGFIASLISEVNSEAPFNWSAILIFFLAVHFFFFLYHVQEKHLLKKISYYLRSL